MYSKRSRGDSFARSGKKLGKKRWKGTRERERERERERGRKSATEELVISFASVFCVSPWSSYAFVATTIIEGQFRRATPAWKKVCPENRATNNDRARIRIPRAFFWPLRDDLRRSLNDENLEISDSTLQWKEDNIYLFEIMNLWDSPKSSTSKYRKKLILLNLNWI